MDQGSGGYRDSWCQEHNQPLEHHEEHHRSQGSHQWKVSHHEATWSEEKEDEEFNTETLDNQLRRFGKILYFQK